MEIEYMKIEDIVDAIVSSLRSIEESIEDIAEERARILATLNALREITRKRSKAIGMSYDEHRAAELAWQLEEQLMQADQWAHTSDQLLDMLKETSAQFVKEMGKCRIQMIPAEADLMGISL